MLCDMRDDNKVHAAMFISEILFVRSRDLISVLPVIRLFPEDVWPSLVPNGKYLPTLLENPRSALWPFKLVSF